MQLRSVLTGLGSMLAPAGALAQSQVPEPATIVLSALAGAVVGLIVVLRGRS